ncbi:hypothetical protein KACHI17_11460 [Sediminibacterium sp. KACHI17]|uniref:Metal-dependent hydrolase n=2 Tax=Sediminibacterium sp. KACHI17 TaxID=1751071 RepID=A0AAT9GI19_9BACT
MKIVILKFILSHYLLCLNLKTTVMFIGHFGLAFAAKKLSPSNNLGASIMSAQLLDLIWPILTLAGIENFSIEPGITKLTPLNFQYYPYSHSLIASIFLGVIVGVIYYMIRKDRTNAIIYGVLVVSHWVLDFLTHRPDLPISFSDEQKYGMGLWNYPAISIIVEILIFITGIYLYFNQSVEENQKGKWLPWTIVILLAIFFVMNIIGPPPPSTNAVSYSALLLWLFVGLGYWAEKNRRRI